MPVRLKSKKGRRARLGVTLDAAIGAIEGTVSAASVYSGRIQGLVYDFTGALTGIFAANIARSGTIVTQLDHFGGTIYGSEDYPATWTDGLGDTFSLIPNAPFSYTFTATDPDGDPIEFTWDPLLVPSWMTITEMPQAGTTRDLVISSTTGPPAPVPPATSDSYAVVAGITDGIAPVSTRTFGFSVAAAADWQLAAGHYVPAKMTPVIVHPRPDTETQAWERCRRSPDGIAWSIPIAVQGGAWPFRYTVDETSAAKGIAIGEQYGSANYGVLSWASPTLGSHTITVTVYTQEYGRNTSGLGDSVSVTFTLEVASRSDTSKFIFLDITNGRNYTAGATGSYSDPFKHFNDWYRANNGASFVGRQVFYRGGTYPFVNGAETAPGVFNMSLNSGNMRVASASAPMVHVAYPGETVVFNCADPAGATSGLNYGGKWVGSSKCDGLYMQDVEMRNGRQDAANSHFFWLTGRSNEQRVTLFRNRFVSMGPGTVGTDNPSVMFGSTITFAARARYYAIIGNYYSGLGGSTNGVSAYDLYRTEYSVVENNVAENCTSRFLFWCKALNGFWSIRNNVAWNNIATASDPCAVIEVNSNLTTDQLVPYITPIEVCYNRVRNLSSVNDLQRRYGIAVDVVDSEVGDKEYHVYRNTVGGSVADEGNITPGSSLLSNLVLRNTGQTVAYKGWTEISPVNNVVLANGDLDGNGLLTGTARNNYLGTHGAEIA